MLLLHSRLLFQFFSSTALLHNSQTYRLIFCSATTFSSSTVLVSGTGSSPPNPPPLLLLLRRSFSAQPQHSDPTSTPSSSSESDSEFDFNSTQYDLPTTLSDPKPQTPTWDNKYRSKADRVVPGDEAHKAKLRFLKEKEDERRRRVLAKALLEAALERGDEEEEDGEEEVVKEEDQKSVTVGIIGAPNAGKSALTNYLVCLFSSFRVEGV
ncbi:hypothetical protein ACLB2K_006169 [Fragaria x ananassa]